MKVYFQRRPFGCSWSDRHGHLGSRWPVLRWALAWGAGFGEVSLATSWRQPIRGVTYRFLNL
jgi:hypothetical protein